MLVSIPKQQASTTLSGGSVCHRTRDRTWHRTGDDGGNHLVVTARICGGRSWQSPIYSRTSPSLEISRQNRSVVGSVSLFFSLPRRFCGFCGFCARRHALYVWRLVRARGHAHQRTSCVRSTVSAARQNCRTDISLACATIKVCDRLGLWLSNEEEPV